MMHNRIMIGGKAMNFYGSNRLTSDVDYLVFEPGREVFFEHDGGDIVNAAAHPFLHEVWKQEQGNQIVSPQGLMELKAFAFINHCQIGAFMKTYDDEYDMKYLAHKFDIFDVPLIKHFMSPGEYGEVLKILNAVRVQKKL